MSSPSSEASVGVWASGSGNGTTGALSVAAIAARRSSDSATRSPYGGERQPSFISSRDGAGSSDTGCHAGAGGGGGGLLGGLGHTVVSATVAAAAVWTVAKLGPRALASVAEEPAQLPTATSSSWFSPPQPSPRRRPGKSAAAATTAAAGSRTLDVRPHSGGGAAPRGSARDGAARASALGDAALQGSPFFYRDLDGGRLARAELFGVPAAPAAAQRAGPAAEGDERRRARGQQKQGGKSRGEQLLAEGGARKAGGSSKKAAATLPPPSRRGDIRSAAGAGMGDDAAAPPDVRRWLAAPAAALSMVFRHVAGKNT